MITFASSDAHKSICYSFLHAISQLIQFGFSCQTLRKASGKSVSQLARSVGTQKKDVRRAIAMQGIFVAKFGSAPLEFGDDWEEPALINPAQLKMILKEPAALTIASEVTSFPEAKIRRIINHI